MPGIFGNVTYIKRDELGHGHMKMCACLIEWTIIQGAAKKVAPQSFLPFSRQLFGVLSNFFLEIYILIYYYLSAK